MGSLLTGNEINSFCFKVSRDFAFDVTNFIPRRYSATLLAVS